jgi:autotransporter-associated beta strand protein
LLDSKNGTNAFNFNGGTLQATSTNAGATFWVSSTAMTANVRNGGGTIDNNGTSITIAQALVHSTIDGDNATDGGLTFSGAGTTTLSGTNTFTGPTMVNTGMLILGSSGSLAGSISLSVASGGTLQLDQNVSLNDTITLSLVSGTTLDLNFAFGTDETIGALVLNGTTAPAGTYDAAALAGLGGASGITFTGTGSLTVAAVPEPNVVALIVVGLFGALTFARRRNPPSADAKF